MLTIQINGCAAIAWLAKPCYQNLHGEHCSNALASACDVKNRICEGANG